MEKPWWEEPLMRKALVGSAPDGKALVEGVGIERPRIRWPSSILPQPLGIVPTPGLSGSLSWVGSDRLMTMCATVVCAGR